VSLNMTETDNRADVEGQQVINIKSWTYMGQKWHASVGWIDKC